MSELKPPVVNDFAEWERDFGAERPSHEPGVYLIRYGSHWCRVSGVHIMNYAPDPNLNHYHWWSWGGRQNNLDGGEIFAGPFSKERVIATLTAHLCDSCREVVRVKMEQSHA